MILVKATVSTAFMQVQQSSVTALQVAATSQWLNCSVSTSSGLLCHEKRLSPKIHIRNEVGISYRKRKNGSDMCVPNYQAVLAETRHSICDNEIESRIK
jgi:hypothetical protein